MPQSGRERPAMPRASTLPAEVFHSRCGRSRIASGSLPAHHPPQASALAVCCPPCALSDVGRPEGAGRKYRAAGARREGRVRPGDGGGFVAGLLVHWWNFFHKCFRRLPPRSCPSRFLSAAASARAGSSPHGSRHRFRGCWGHFSAAPLARMRVSYYMWNMQSKCIWRTANERYPVRPG